MHAAARFLPQVVPDLRDIAAERAARYDLRRTRARQVDVHHALEPSGPVGHHQDAVGKLNRLGDIVSDQQRRLLKLLLKL